MEKDRHKLINVINANVVAQGGLSDCWLISAIAGVCEFPELITRTIFKNQNSLSNDGRQTLSLQNCQKKEFEDVTIDDYIPCKTKEGWWEIEPKPIFGKVRNREVFPVLIEKAFAKYAGGYSNIGGGHELVAFMKLTGCETQQKWVVNLEKQI